MKNFEHIIDHYKDHIRLDNETAWNIICRFKDIVENKNDKDNEISMQRGRYADVH